MPAKKTTTKRTVRKNEPQKMVGFGEAIKRFWINYFHFKGTAQRSEFWFVYLFMFLVDVIITLFEFISPIFTYLLAWPWMIAVCIPSWALFSRRFHDAGFSSKWFFIPLFIVATTGLLASSSYLLGDPELFTNTIGIWALTFILPLYGFVIFWFVVTLLPSKMKDNPYRK